MVTQKPRGLLQSPFGVSPAPLDHRYARALGPARERILQRFYLGGHEHQRTAARVVLGVAGVRRFGDREQLGAPREERQRDLARRRPVARRDLRQQFAAVAFWRKAARAERRVADDGDLLLFARRQDGVLYLALFQVIEHLIAGDAAGPGERDRLGELALVEVAHAVVLDLALAHQLLERLDRVAERVVAGPVQEVAVQVADAQPL